MVESDLLSPCGGLVDVLEEAKRGDRRFVAVICGSIEHVARITYFGTKIEYELEQCGVALLAADEGIDPAAISALGQGREPSGDPDFDTAWRGAIQDQFAANLAEQRTTTAQVADITRQRQDQTRSDIDPLDAVSQAAVDVTQL